MAERRRETSRDSRLIVAAREGRKASSLLLTGRVKRLGDEHDLLAIGSARGSRVVGEALKAEAQPIKDVRERNPTRRGRDAVLGMLPPIDLNKISAMKKIAGRPS
eukprot:755860-Hanusia_phi.AAC.3